MDFKEAKRVYMVGIGGIGMSGLARLLKSRGVYVHGSDSTESGITQKLQAEGISVEIGHSNPNGDFLVYSEAVPPEDSARLWATEQGIPSLNYFQALGEFTSDYKVIAIAGTHGKTTTTAMVGLILIAAGLDPTVLVGSNLKEFDGKNVRIGQSEWFVVEACEYRRNFMTLKPEILAILNVELDHVDYYKNAEDYERAFEELAAQSKEVIHQDAYSAYELPLGVPGDHNRKNAGMAALIARRLGIATSAIHSVLSQFSGTWRRFEYRGEYNGAMIYDDYAHHPTEIRATLAGTREIHPDAKIRVVFQPHQYNRTAGLLEEFGKAFEGADEVIIPNIYEVRDSAADKAAVSPERLVEEIQKHHQNARFGDGVENTALYLRETAQVGDLILVMGAGPIDAIIPMVIGE